MKRAIPWIIAAVAVVAFVASFSELQRMRGRFGELTRHQFHDHQDVRETIIRDELIGLDQPIVVIGDSITEMARLPETINGHPVVNAGIGGSTISDFQFVAPRIIDDSVHPFMIVVALGANDAGSGVRENYATLLARLKPLSPRLLAVAVTPKDGADAVNAQIKAAAESEGVSFVDVPIPEGSILPDHVHLNAAGYRDWLPTLITAISHT